LERGEIVVLGRFRELMRGIERLRVAEDTLFSPGEVVCAVEMVRHSPVVLGASDQSVHIVEVAEQAIGVHLTRSQVVVLSVEVNAFVPVQFRPADVRAVRIELLEMIIDVAAEYVVRVEEERHQQES